MMNSQRVNEIYAFHTLVQLEAGVRNNECERGTGNQA